MAVERSPGAALRSNGTGTSQSGAARFGSERSAAARKPRTSSQVFGGIARPSARAASCSLALISVTLARPAEAGGSPVTLHNAPSHWTSSDPPNANGLARGSPLLSAARNRAMNASRSADIAARIGRPAGSRDSRPAAGPVGSIVTVRSSQAATDGSVRVTAASGSQ